MGKRKVHIEDFFTRTNAEEGVWVEPKIEGEGCGFEFLVTGATTNEAIADDEHYEKLYTEAEDIKDPIQRNEKKMKIDAERCARLVKGIRAAPDCEVDFGGNGIEYSTKLIEEILFQSPLIKQFIVNFSTRTANFIKRENNA